MSFADAIIKLRSKRRISQKELAEELNVVKAEAKQYSQWYYRKAEELEKIRKQVKAVATIIDAVGC